MSVAPLVVVTLLAIATIVAILRQQDRNANQVSHLLAHMAQRQTAHARERFELCTRLQAPQVAAAGMVAQPAMPDPREVLETLGLLQPGVPGEEGDVYGADDDDDIDESHLVGTGPASPPASELA